MTDAVPDDRSAGRLGAIVLAGGRSQRFGRDKLAEPVDGRLLLDRAVVAVASLGSAVDVVVVAAADDDRVVPAGRLVRDPRPYEGPLAGVHTGLVGLAPGADPVIVVGGDMPTLVPAVLETLVAAVEGGASAAILEGDDRPRPLPMAVRREAATTVAAALLAGGERRLRALPAQLAAVVIPAAAWRPLDPDAATLRDIDTPDDL
jgi:molybdopterin-guanine dinucleotide biosynthesis protein A